LLYLIQSQELDINSISIGRITDQYLAYVRLMQELNFDIASEFLVMAATLLHWKSKAILPQEQKADAQNAEAEDGALTQEDLIRQLLEHQRFRAAAQDLGQLPQLGESVFVRPNRRPPIERVWKELNISSLAVCYQNILVRQRKRTQLLKKETVSLADKIQTFRSKLQFGKLLDMRDLMALTPDRPEIVVTFLASLELSRLKRLRLHQQEPYQSILLELIQSLENFDPSIATGFDSIADAMEKKGKESDAAVTAAVSEVVSVAEETSPAEPSLSSELNPGIPPSNGDEPSWALALELDSTSGGPPREPAFPFAEEEPAAIIAGNENSQSESEASKWSEPS
jgi:segregation and condensation protein A